jgi:hypothetical protein
MKHLYGYHILVDVIDHTTFFIFIVNVIKNAKLVIYNLAKGNIEGTMCLTGGEVRFIREWKLSKLGFQSLNESRQSV